MPNPAPYKRPVKPAMPLGRAPVPYAQAPVTYHEPFRIGPSPDVLRQTPMTNSQYYGQMIDSGNRVPINQTPYAGERMQVPAQGGATPPPPQAQPPFGAQPFNYYPNYNASMQGRSLGIGPQVLGAGTGGQPLPVNNPYVSGAAPIQQRAARVQQYANSFPAAQAAGVPGGGLLTDAGANQLYAESGYMPSTTIGGNWNRRQMGRHPLARLSTRQQKDLMRVDANTAAYEADQARRQAALSQPMTNEQAAAFAQRSRGLEPLRGRDIDPRRMQMLIRQGVISGPDDVVGMRASTGLRDSLGERGLLGQPDQEQLDINRMDYEIRRGAEMAGRRDRVQGRAAEASEQRRQILAQRNQTQGGGDILNALAMRDPRLALGVMQLRQQGRLAEAEMMMRQGALNLQGQEMAQRGELGRGALEIQRQEAANRASQMQIEREQQRQRDLVQSNSAYSQMMADAQAQEDAGNYEAADSIRARASMVGGDSPQAPSGVKAARAISGARNASQYEGLGGGELFAALAEPLDAISALGENATAEDIQRIASRYGVTSEMLQEAAAYYPTPNKSVTYNTTIEPMLSFFGIGPSAASKARDRRRRSAAMSAMSLVGGR